MTRNIVFRGLNEDKDWVSGSLIYRKNSSKTFIVPQGYTGENPNVSIEVATDTVQQFADMYDIHGIPIYENDIIKITIASNNNTYTEYGIIRFDNLKVFAETSGGDKPLYQFPMDAEIEVIGNEVTNEEKCLLLRINNFLKEFIPDDFEEFSETAEMYALIRDSKKYLEKQTQKQKEIGADDK